MDKNPEKTFHWIVGILNMRKIQFQVDGGLAARAYGADRELVDIDLVIHEGDFDKIIDDVKEFIKYGPEHYMDEKWDLKLMTLFHENQTIDIPGARNTKYFDGKNNIWVQSENTLEKSTIKNLLGLNVPVIPLDHLIKEKQILDREVDRIDLSFINKKSA